MSNKEILISDVGLMQLQTKHHCTFPILCGVILKVMHFHDALSDQGSAFHGSFRAKLESLSINDLGIPK